MKKIVFACILVLFSTTVAVASDNKVSSFFDYFQIRESLKSDKSDKPASFTYIFPAGERSSYSVNAGIGYDLLNLFNSDPHLKDGIIFFNYAKNNQIKKPQDTYTTGAGISLQTLINTNKGFGLIVPLDINYKKDKIAKSDSLQSSLFLTATSNNLTWLPGSANLIFGELGKMADGRPDISTSNGFFLRYKPKVAFEYENVYHTADASKTGGTLRFLLNGNITIKSSYTDSKYKFLNGVQLSVEDTYRRDLVDNVEKLDDDHNLFQTRLDLVLYKFDPDPKSDQQVALGIEYKNGEDPSDGFQKQEMTTVKLNFLY